MSGRPANAQNISVMRPFSRRWAMVSMPLPVRSRYATVCVVEHAERVEALGRAVDVTVVGSSGAVATKNTGCASRNSRELRADAVEHATHQAVTAGTGAAPAVSTARLAW